LNRSEVRAFIKAGVDALEKVAEFRNGMISDFNSDPNKPYPYVWMESLGRTETRNIPNSKQETWNVVLHVAFKDTMDSKPEVYEALKDKADAIAGQLCDIYDRGLKKSSLVTMPTRNIEPFHKRHADVLTGVILSFDLITPTSTFFCVDLDSQC
jgi:hypothetical protein